MPFDDSELVGERIGVKLFARLESSAELLRARWRYRRRRAG